MAFPRFPDFTDIDPYEGWLEHFWDALDTRYEPVQPRVSPTPYDLVYEASSQDEADDPFVLHFSRGYNFIKVVMKRSITETMYIPEAEKLLEQQHALELCLSLLPTIQEDGGYTVILHPNPHKAGYHKDVKAHEPPLLYQGTCPLHIIDEKQVRITQWRGPGGYDEGMWGELTIDIRRPRNAEEAATLREDIESSLKFPRCYVFPFLAATRRGSRIIGAICEAREGLPLRYSDRDAVYHALQVLEDRGLVYVDVRETHLAISVHDGNVKFLYPARLIDRSEHPCDEQTWQRLIKRRHRDAFNNLFQRLMKREAIGLRHKLGLARYYKASCFILPQQPEPFLEIAFNWPDGWRSFRDIIDGVLDERRFGGKRKKRTARQRLEQTKKRGPPDQQLALGGRAHARLAFRGTQAVSEILSHYRQASPPAWDDGASNIATRPPSPDPSTTDTSWSHISRGGFGPNGSISEILAEVNSLRATSPAPSTISSAWSHVYPPSSISSRSWTDVSPPSPSTSAASLDFVETSVGSLYISSRSQSVVSTASHSTASSSFSYLSG
jgi:hypothetical protein